MNAGERTLWVGFITLALGYLLLGYSFGEGAQGKVFSIGDIASMVAVIISIGFLYYAHKGLREYKKQHRYEGAKEAAESILKSKALLKVIQLSRHFELVCYAAIEITANRNTEYQVSNEDAHRLLNDIRGYLDQIKKLIEEIDEISVTNIMFKYENSDIYNEISELLDSTQTFSEKMERYFGQSRSLKDDPDDRYNIRIAENLAGKFKDVEVGNIVDNFAEVMEISYPISNKLGKQMFKLSKKLEEILSGSPIDR